jgi:hypothetical protein
MWQDCRILAEQEEFDEEFSATCELPSLAARRAEAKKLAKKLVTKHENIMRWSDEIGVDDLVAGHRADQIVALTLRGFQDACQWTEQPCREIFDRSWWKENIVDPDGN